jgi:PKD repeat protein
LALLALGLAGCKGVSPPTAGIAPISAVTVGTVVLLDGTASTDPQSRPLEYRWHLSGRPPGSRAAILNARLAVASLQADADGEYQVSLVVGNGELTARAVTTVTASCAAPAPTIAVRATPEKGSIGVPIAFEATDQRAAPAESCPKLAPLTRWTWQITALPPGSETSLGGADGPSPSLVPDLSGRYSVLVTAIDSKGAVAASSISVEVSQCGTAAPVIESLNASPAGVGGVVTLTAAVLDPDAKAPCSRDEEIRRAWRFLARPPGSLARLNDATLESPSFVPDREGTYSVELAVKDPAGHSASRAITVDVARCGGNPPAVDAVTATPSAPGVGRPVAFSATLKDADNDAGCDASQSLSAHWGIARLPFGSRARLNDEKALRPWLIPDVPGEYELWVRAVDSTGRKSAPSSFVLTATKCGSALPVASVTVPAAGKIGSPVQLSAVVTDEDAKAPCSRADVYTYSWSLESVPKGSAAQVNGRGLVNPTFIPDVAGQYGARLVALDTDGHASAPAFATVTVASCGGHAPTAVPSTATATPSVGRPVLLAATAIDLDNDTDCGAGQTFSYSWSQSALPAGSLSVLNHPDAVAPSFTPDKAGSYEVKLVALDSTGLRSPPSSLTIIVSDCGSEEPDVQVSASTATPSVGQPVLLGSTVTDPDNAAPCSARETFTYAWSMSALPAGSRASLNLSTAAAPSFVPDLPGAYIVRLTVTDSAGHKSAPASVSVTATDCGSDAPVVQATASTFSPGVGQPVQLSAVVTDDDNNPPCSAGQALTVKWDIESLPAGSLATIAHPTAFSASFVPDVDGAYSLTAVASDSTGRTSLRSKVLINASTCGAAAPLSQASVLNASPAIGDVVQLSASATDSDNVAPCGASQSFTYSWAFTTRPKGSAASLNSATVDNPTFVPDVDGTYGLSVTAIDSTGRKSAPAAVTVTVSPCGGNRPTVSVARSPASVGVGMTATLVPTVVDLDNGAACQARPSPLPPQTFSFEWTMLAAPLGSAAVLSGSTRREPSFLADRTGTYVARLVVRDSSGRVSESVEISVQVSNCGSNAPAVLDAKADNATPNAGQPVLLTGTFSDADDAAACQAILGAVQSHAFSWSVASAPAGSQARLSTTAGAFAGFTPDVAGAYSFVFTVTDATGRSASASASLTASSCGAARPTVAPAVDPASVLRVGSAILVKANGADADNAASCAAGQTLSYAWSLLEQPAGSRVRMANPAAKDVSFVPDVAGTYVAAVTARDSTGRVSDLGTVSVAVVSCGGSAPVALARIASPVTVGPSADVVLDPLLSCSFELDARDSTDADTACGLPQTGADLFYEWELMSSPLGSKSRLVTPSRANPWFDVDVGGTFLFRVNASDGTYLSAKPATVKVVHRGFTIDKVSPAVACVGGAPTSLTLTGGGQGFLVASGINPDVRFAGNPAAIQSMSGCTSTSVAGVTSCTTMVISIPIGLGIGNYPIVARNPVKDGCRALGIFSVGPAPTITGVAPRKVCEQADPLRADAVTLNVQGSGYVDATQVSLSGGRLAKSVTLNSGSDLDALFDIPPPGAYALTVSNGGGCESTRLNAVTVLTVPLVFFVDPPVLYNGIATQATVYISGLNGGGVSGVRTRPLGSAAPPSPIPFTFDSKRPNQVQATVPAGLAVGDYEVFVTDAESCTSRPVTGFRVTNTLTLALTKIDPPFGWKDEDTSACTC